MALSHHIRVGSFAFITLCVASERVTQRVMTQSGNYWIHRCMWLSARLCHFICG